LSLFINCKNTGAEVGVAEYNFYFYFSPLLSLFSSLLLFSLSPDEYKLFLEQREEKLKADAISAADAEAEALSGKKK